MENLWKMIAKARGVELDEEFKWNGLIYQITDYDGLLVLDCSCAWVTSGRTHGFIKGEGKIEKIPFVPFVPKVGENYWTYGDDGEIPKVEFHTWHNDCYDKIRKILGVIFRTEQKAIDYLPTWKKRLEGEEM